MPPLIVVALGTLGAMLAGRWVAHEVRRRVAETTADHTNAGAADGEPARKLERDPATGVYRPK
jgi:hypothetical protein